MSIGRFAMVGLALIGLGAACTEVTSLAPTGTGGGEGEGGGGSGGKVPVSMPCALGDDDACGPGEKCTVVDPTTGETACAPAGDTEACEPCDADGDCVAGTYCNEGRCALHCAAADDCTSLTCVDAVGPDEATVPGLDVCRCGPPPPGPPDPPDPPDPPPDWNDGCNPLDWTPCNPGEGCLPDYDEPSMAVVGWACRPAMPPYVGLSEACGGIEQVCGPGLVCLVDAGMMPSCVTVCFVDAPGTEPLYPCQGACMPVFFPSGPDVIPATHMGQALGSCL